MLSLNNGIKDATDRYSGNLINYVYSSIPNMINFS
jgi:hypothetical protein